MGRTAKDKRPHLPPVERIELREGNTKGRLIAVGALLLLGAGMLAYSVYQLLSPQTEWIAVEAGAGEGPTCGDEFLFWYRLGGGERSPMEERRAVNGAYTQLCREAFQLFHAQAEFEGVNNLYAINRRPNEVLAIEPGLYGALAAADKSGSRMLYLGPVYSRYDDLFYCQDDSQLADFDPRLSEDVAREYREVLAYANDPSSIQVELLGENKVRLKVSDAYLAYAAREGIEDFIDFAWMRNAFIADFLADGLSAQGYTHGTLTSYDGFIRNLDGGGTEYALQLYDRREGKLLVAAEMHYQGPMAVVCLRDYPVNEMDEARFYQLRTGEVRTPYLDAEDAFCRSALSSLTCYSADKGCGEMLLAMLPGYISDDFAPEAVTRLTAEDIQSIWIENGVIVLTEAGVQLSNLYANEEVRYTTAPAKP